jgi:ABC-2 type transport system permease protein
MVKGPSWARTKNIALFSFASLPLTYAVDALRKVMVLGVDIGGVVVELLLLVAISIVTIALGVPLFDRAVRK